MIKKIFICLLVLLCLPLNSVAALIPAQKRVIDSGVQHFDVNRDTVCSSGATLSGKDNIAKIYNYLLGKPVAGQPLKDFQVAGIMGNMQHESGYEPMRLQSTHNDKDEQEALAKGWITKFTPGDDGLVSSEDIDLAKLDTLAQTTDTKVGWGLVQWTTPGKMVTPVRTAGKNPDDLVTQLDFLLGQLNGGGPDGAAGKALVATTDAGAATTAFETGFERHQGDPDPTRITEAERILKLVSSGGLQPVGSTPGGKPVIVLDPGHGGTKIDRIDPESGLHDGDFNNPTERVQVFAVAQMAQTQLEQAGYQVVLTKANVADSVFLRDRADVANNANAALAVSIHTQGDRAFGTWQEIYTQKVGLYRGTGSNKVTFKDAAVAQKSQAYADIMKQERDKIEVTSGTTVIKDNSFNDRGDIEPGNIPLVELWSQVPWIYLEAGGNNTTNGLSEQQKATYAEAIVSGIKKAIPATGAASASTSRCGTSTGLTGTVSGYAWPEYRPAGTSGAMEMKPDYQQAVQTAKAKGVYVGGTNLAGIDCGGFVTLLMINSGYEPNYNYGGVISAGASNVGLGQTPWLQANWQLVNTDGHVNSSSELRPGDVAIKKDRSHTYMFIGDQKPPGFGSVTASASLDERAPMASPDDVTSSNIEWYRKK